ncbi:MAG: hypothetical protein F4041_16830 [Acidobacteriia bacterium]|nr:hypothetical protein [Terriglobia bacterium]
MELHPGPGEGVEVLLPYQRAWIADQSQWKIAEKSRRSGLTWAEAADAALTAAKAPSAGGCNHSYVGSGKDMAREFIDAAAMWGRHFELAAGEIGEEVFVDGDREITVYRIDFASGFHIQALSSNPSNLRGRKGNATIDEAAFQELLAQVVKAAAALTMWGGKVRVVSTHNGEGSEFNSQLQDARAGRNDWSVHRIPLEEACEQGLYRRICLVNGERWSPEAEIAWKAGLRRNAGSPEAAAEEYDCVPLHGSGAYLSRALIESCMRDAPVLRFNGSAGFNAMSGRLREAEVRDWCERELKPLLEELDPRLQHVLGEDFGRTADLTVLAPMQIAERLRLRVPFLVELHNVPFRNQEQILYYACDRLPRLRALKLDARGNGQYLAEQAVYRYGQRAEAVMPTQAWYLEHMPPFKASFEDGRIEIPRDDDTASDLRALRTVQGIPKVPDVRTGGEGDRHGDAAIALCMAHAASRADPVEYGFRRVPRLGDDAARRDPRLGSGGREWRQVRAGVGWTRGML